MYFEEIDICCWHFSFYLMIKNDNYESNCSRNVCFHSKNVLSADKFYIWNFWVFIFFSIFLLSILNLYIFFLLELFSVYLMNHACCIYWKILNFFWSSWFVSKKVLIDYWKKSKLLIFYVWTDFNANCDLCMVHLWLIEKKLDSSATGTIFSEKWSKWTIFFLTFEQIQINYCTVFFFLCIRRLSIESVFSDRARTSKSICYRSI